MAQIIFINPFDRTAISGGIKNTYLKAELLRELGFNAVVFQPDGPPVWCSERLQALAVDRVEPSANDILVFPETLTGSLEALSQAPSPARKVLFCQNQFYMFSYGLTADDYASRGFHNFIVSGEWTKGALSRILGLTGISVVPSFIDPKVFYPRGKQMRIVTAPRKYPAHGAIPAHGPLIQRMLHLKYPHLRSVPWAVVEEKSEQEVAELMGQSTVFLSLCNMESLPVTPLEAMASGCVVVGYHGYGGLEYANATNGFWVSPEFLEDVVDALAEAVEGIGRGDSQMLAVRDAGIATAATYSKERTKVALKQAFGGLLGW